MSTLNATNLKNPSSGGNNIVLAADGSVTMSTLNASAMNYSSGLRCCALGTLVEGGYLFAKQGSLAWIVACSSRQVSRNWASRGDAVTVANNSNACGDWFVPSFTDLIFANNCKTFWDSYSNAVYWSSTPCNVAPGYVWYVNFDNGINQQFGCNGGNAVATCIRCVRAFRRVAY